MNRYRILVADDEESIVDLVRQLLLRRGYEVFTAGDGDTALQMIYDLKPDLVVLDLMLPRMDGWEVCRRVREDPEIGGTPVLMLTARRDERDLVAGLELGADDYVKKPFSTAELSARIAAILRRMGSEKAEKQLTNGDLLIDLENESVHLRGREVLLSPTEFRLLETLASRMGRMVARESLLSCIWNTLECDTRAIDVYVSRLRKKLDDGASPALTVESRRGRGYRLTWAE